MELLVEQLVSRGRELAQWLEFERGPAAEVRLVKRGDDAARWPNFDDSAAPHLAPGGDWREPLNQTVWLRFSLTRPPHWPAADTVLIAHRFGTLPMEPSSRVGRELQRLQGLLYLAGQPYHGLDQYHRLIYLPEGPDYHFAANVWTGLAELEWQPNPTFHLARIDRGAVHLSYDLLVLADALRVLPSDDPARPRLERIADAALQTMDWSSVGSERSRGTFFEAHRHVESELAALPSTEYAPTLTAVGHAHIDCAWLWPISQTREKAGRTWTTALRLMERYPEYRFLASTPLQYEMVQQRFPETFAGIRERLREGRWEAVGGMWVEADCNLPDGESLARQFLVGTRYFERELGISPRVVWLPDSFGFTWALPTLMAAAGLPYFVTHKLSWSTTNRIPHDTFRWRGPDGSEVLAHFLCTPSLTPGEHTTYNGHLLPGVARGAWKRFQDRELQDELLVAFGWGDGGGGPSIDMLEAGRRLEHLPGFPRVRMGNAHEFFQRLEHTLAERADVPVWDGELYLEYHRGTYTGQARQKRRNALAQRLFHAAELYAACARTLVGADYPRDELEAGWKLILTNQFHDILPGSAISQVYREAEDDFRELNDIGSRVLDAATSGIGAALELASDALVVFNPSPYTSAGYVEVSHEAAGGVALPVQPTAGGGVLVWCEGVPPNGYQAFPAFPTGPSPQPPSSQPPSPQPPSPVGELRASTAELETPFWHIELDGSGRIARLVDKRHNRAVAPAGNVSLGNRLVVFEDRPLNYDAWDIDAFHRAKFRDVDQLESAEVRESGPERAVVELSWRFGERTRIVQRMCVYARSPRIDFQTRVDWQERQSLLKVAFPTSIRSRRATYEIQFGSIERPTHHNTSWDEAAFEVPAQRWVDLSDAQYGVALLADCKHGYSVHDATLWLSLLKGAIDPDPDADRGEHAFTYSLLPHALGLDEVRRAAYDLTRPLLWRREPAHPGALPPLFSLAAVDDGVALVETAKWAEDTDALILRLYEPAGGAGRATLRLGRSPRAVDEVDLLERNPRGVSFGADGVPLDLRAHEVKTLRIACG
jgi:alpha-mannosidase